jgi:hypothetical protein
MPVIGLYSSVMGSGKSTIANYLVEKHGFVLVKFAEPLKAMIETLVPFLNPMCVDPKDYTEGSEKEKKLFGFDGLTTRRLMQTLGTEWGRNTIMDDFWVRIAKNRINTIRAFSHGEVGGIVIDDLRFPNEYQVLKELGAEFWKVERPDAVEYVEHASEGLLNNHYFNISVDNDGSTKDLEDLVDYFVSKTTIDIRA